MFCVPLRARALLVVAAGLAEIRRLAVCLARNMSGSRAYQMPVSD